MFKSFYSLIMPIRESKLRPVPEIFLGGGGPQTFFCPVGGGCFVDNVSEGWWGWTGNLSWGSRHI